MESVEPARHRRAAATALAVVLALLTPAGCRRSDPGPPRLNLIVVSADTLNRSALRVYAPEAQALHNLDRFADGAVVFRDAHTTAPWTLPSHVSLFTGLYPGHHGITRLEQRWSGAWPTLPELMYDGGYRTVAFTDGALLASEYGHAAGFERYDAELLDGDFPADLALPRDGAPGPVSGLDLFDRAVAFLEGHERDDRPFFLFLHTFSVHDYFYQYADRVPPLPANLRRRSFIDCLVGASTCNAEQWRHLRERYDAGVRGFDEGFGRLLEAVTAAGLDDSTVIVLLSDHGEGLAPQRERIHHAGRLHEDQLRIPLMLRAPGRSGSVGAAVSLVDLLPTLLELVDLPAPSPADLDGFSLIGVIDDERGELPPRALYASEYAYDWVDGKREYLPSDRPLHVAVIRDGLWYIEDPRGERLFAMAEDPLQERNLAPGHPSLEALRKLARAAAGWDGPTADPVPVDEELLEHLRSLGYIQ